MTRPQLRPDQYQTYGIKRPAGTHWRPATCEQVDCAAYLYGWTTGVDERTDLGAAQAHYLRRESGRSFTEDRGPDGITRFTFPAGQACFKAGEHRAPLEREPLYVVRGGNLRVAVGRARVHSGPDPWLDDFATNQDRLNTAAQRG